MPIESFRDTLAEKEHREAAAAEKSEEDKISQLWAKSAERNAEIAANPWKFPWQYFNMWLDGQLPRKEK